MTDLLEILLDLRKVLFGLLLQIHGAPPTRDATTGCSLATLRAVKRWLIALLLLSTACSPAAVTSTTAATSTTIASTTTATSVDLVNACDPPTFLPTVLPARAAATQPNIPKVPLDQFTMLPGTTIHIWSDDSDQPVMVVIRGALPPVKWIETPEHITVRGVDAAFGPLPDGVWGAAWYEGPDTCDEYSVIFYPPVDVDEARMVAESMTGGS